MHSSVWGTCCSDKGDLAGAEAAFREAIRLDPTLARAQLGLGVLLWHKQDLAGAEAAFREAIRLDPTVANTQLCLGLVLGDKQDLAGAEAAYREAIRIDPKYALAHTVLGLVLEEMGSLEGAVTEYREALRIDPKESQALSNLPLAEGMRAVTAVQHPRANHCFSFLFGECHLPHDFELAGLSRVGLSRLRSAYRDRVFPRHDHSIPVGIHLA